MQGKTPHHALRLLELGRGVISGLLLEMRTGISDLREQYPELAQEFESLRNELDSPTGGTTASIPNENTHLLANRINRRHEANRKLDEHVKKIRDQPEFERFLLPLTAGEMMTAAKSGPIVVVNISHYRCDAFLVEHYQIRAMRLHHLKQAEVKGKAQQLRSSAHVLSMLEWLWDIVAKPVLEALSLNQPPSGDE